MWRDESSEKKRIKLELEATSAEATLIELMFNRPVKIKTEPDMDEYSESREDSKKNVKFELKEEVKMEMKPKLNADIKMEIKLEEEDVNLTHGEYFEDEEIWQGDDLTTCNQIIGLCQTWSRKLGQIQGVNARRIQKQMRKPIQRQIRAAKVLALYNIPVLNKSAGVSAPIEILKDKGNSP